MFDLNVDGFQFTASKESVDYLIRKMNLHFSYTNRTCLYFCVVDSSELLKYLLECIKGFHKTFEIYDISRIETESTAEMNDLFRTKPVCLMNFDQLYLRADEDMRMEMKHNLCSNLCLSRDNIFLKYNSNIIFILNSEDFSMFDGEVADDLVDYGYRCNFSQLFKCLDIENANKTCDLYNYYVQKKLSSKVYIKDKK